jgi:hypothetical protein
MKKTTQIINFFSVNYFFAILVVSIFVIFSFYSTSFAQDIESQVCDNLIASTNINSELMTVSYEENGLVLGSDINSYVFNFSKRVYLNLSFNIGYDTESIIKMNSIQLKSFGYKTYLKAVFNYETKQLELGLSNAFLNNYLLKGMKLEFKANPAVGSGALLFVMTL